jgi:hypothetical protein
MKPVKNEPTVAAPATLQSLRRDARIASPKRGIAFTTGNLGASMIGTARLTGESKTDKEKVKLFSFCLWLSQSLAGGNVTRPTS